MKNLVENYVNELLEEWEAEDQALEEEYYSDLDNLNEELENLLLEGNMPRDLIAAYRRSNKKENATVIGNMPYAERHDTLSYKDRIPYAYDYGKAEYEPLTKEQAFEYLDFRCTNWAPGQPFPADNKLKFNVKTVDKGSEACRNNIKNLRFIIGGFLNEFIYREEGNKGIFEPIYRNRIPQYKFNECGVTVEQALGKSTSNRLDYQKSVRGIFWAIMFAEKIYKTNEYDYKLYDAEHREFVPETVEDLVRNYKEVIDVSKVIVEFFERHKDELTDIQKNIFIPENEQSAEDYINDFLEKYGPYAQAGDVTSDESVFDFSTDYPKLRYHLFNIYVKDILGYIKDKKLKSELENAISQCRDSLTNYYQKGEPTFERDLEYVYTNLINNSDLNDRQKQIYKRRFLNNRHLIMRTYRPMSATGYQNGPYRPEGNYKLGLQQVGIETPDTGDHTRQNYLRKVRNFKQDFVSILQAKDRYKKYYLHAAKNLKTIQNSRASYDSEEEYQVDYEKALSDYNSAKRDYKNKLEDIKKAKAKIILGNLGTAKKTGLILSNHYHYVDAVYRKIKVIKDNLDHLNSLSLSEIIEKFGSLTETWESIQEKIEIILERKRELENRLQQRKQRILELQAELLKLQAENERDSDAILNDSQAIDQLTERQQEVADRHIEDEAIRRLYLDRNELDTLGQTLDNQLKEYHNSFSARKKANADTYKPEDNDQIVSYIEDLNDFAHLLKVDEEEKELADDILSDIEATENPEDILSDDVEEK